MESPSPLPITRATVAAAVDALLKYLRSQAKQRKAQLLEHDDLIYLLLTLKRFPPDGRINPHRISIPYPVHPFDSTSTSICLIADDRPSSLAPPAAVLARVRSESLPISSVIGLSELRSDYHPYESRRRLCDSHDIFFADRQILPLLPRLLGNHFFKRKKIPLAVNLSRTVWPEQIKSVCGSTLLYFRTGVCSGLKIGRVSMERDEIVENVLVAVEKAVELVPKNWANVRSLHVKTSESVALTFYQAVPEMGLKIEGFLDGESDKDGNFTVEGKELGEKKKRSRNTEKKIEKKGRIHEVGNVEVPSDGSDDGREEEMGLKIEGVGDGNVEAGGDDGEKRARKKVKKDNKRKRKNGLKRKKEKEGLMMNGDGDVDVGSGGYEEEKMSGELRVAEGVNKNKRKKDGKARKAKVGEGKESGGEEDGREEKGSDLLSEKKKKRKEKQMEENAVAVVAAGVKKKKSKGKALEGKVAKKIKKSKVRIETD